MAFRIISRIDVKPPFAVKGIQLEGLRQIGDPKSLAEKYYSLGVDEVFFQDIVASLYGTETLGGIESFNFPNIFIPITVGGGVRNVEEAAALVQRGADRISMNSAALRNPSLISDISNVLGSQAIVICIEAKSNNEGSWDLMMDSGRERSQKTLDSWMMEIQGLGAGEILLTSIDHEGTRSGIDYKLVEYVRSRSSLPLIAHGGVGTIQDVLDAVNLGVDGVAIASALHYELIEISILKEELSLNGVEVRL